MTDTPILTGNLYPNWAEAEMVEGYRDGFDLDAPEPSDNRSRSYRHGFANGRDDRRRQPRASAATLRQEAADAIATDLASNIVYWPHL